MRAWVFELECKSGTHATPKEAPPPFGCALFEGTTCFFKEPKRKQRNFRGSPGKTRRFGECRELLGRRPNGSKARTLSVPVG